MLIFVSYVNIVYELEYVSLVCEVWLRVIVIHIINSSFWLALTYGRKT